MFDVERLGPYRILRTIAMGGMGEVYLAALERAGGFEKHVALKCVLPELMTQPRFVELFEREARLAAALTHRNIVQIFDFGRTQGRSWLAMEYVHGVDLKAVMDLVEGPLPIGLVVEIGAACARALDYAHRARDARGKRLAVIHRDVSPQNVLLSFEGDVKLADFGLAQAAARGTDDNRALQGKFAYMSPEQVTGEVLDGRTDQFSLGVVLFELATGRRAFYADDGAEAILGRVAKASPLVSFLEAAPDHPPAIRAVITRAMALARDDRFPDAGSFGSALAAAAATAGVALGVPPLGTWLRALFPHHGAASVPAGVDPMEATAVSADPIELERTDEASSGEHTAAALDPIWDGTTQPPRERTAAAIDPISDTIPPEGPPVAVTPPHELNVSSLATPSTSPMTRGRRAAILVLVMAAVFFWWQQESPRPTLENVEAGGDQARFVDVALAGDTARVTDVAMGDVGRGPPPVDIGASRSADFAAPTVTDAAAIGPAPPRRDARPARRRRRLRRDAGARRPLPAMDAGRRRRDARPRTTPTPLVDASPDTAPAVTPSPPDAGRAPMGPRLRIGAGSAIARIAGQPAGTTWRPLDGRGILIEAEAAGGPKLRARVIDRGGRFVATINATPLGVLTVDGRAMGETPRAGVPLKHGRSTLVVRTPDGNETRLVLELAN